MVIETRINIGMDCYISLHSALLLFYMVWVYWRIALACRDCRFPWSAYGVSQTFYYKKSMAENTRGGIKYETVVNKQLENDIEFINLSSDEEVHG